MTFVNTTKSIICCCRPGNQPAYKQSQEEDHNDNKSDITGRSVSAGIEDNDLELAPFEKNPNLDEGREDEVDEVTSLSSVSLDERVLPAGEENQKVAVVAAAVRPTDGISEVEPAITANPITNPLKPSGSGEKSITKVSNETIDEAADNTIDNNGDIEKVHVSTSIEALEVEEDVKGLLELKISKSVELSVNASDECKAASRSTSRIQEDPIVSALSEAELIAASSNASNESDEKLADTSKMVEVQAIAVSRSVSNQLEDPSISAPDDVEVGEANLVPATRSTSSVSETPLTNASKEVEVTVAQCKSEDSLASTPIEAEVDIRSPSRSASNVSEVKVTGTSRSTSSKSEDFLVNTSKSGEAVGTSKSSLVEEEAISSEGNLMLGLATTSHEGEGKKDDFEVSRYDIASKAMEQRTFDECEEAEKSVQIESKSSQQNLINISLQSDDETKDSLDEIEDRYLIKTDTN